MDQNPHADAILAELGIDVAESCSIIEQDGGKPKDNSHMMPPDFHGATEPKNWHAKTEKPVYRTMALMVVKGATYREIAAATDYSPTQVGWILRQEFMRKMIVGLMNAAGLDPVVTMLQSAGVDSVIKLIELRDTAPAPVALGATKELLNRILGQASQHIIHEQKKVEDPAEEKARLEREIADMQKTTSRGGSGAGEATEVESGPPRT